jgi:FkbM family methyltransferase
MFESFAQNGEDVVLWRALGHLPRGQWIDVGANDPDTDSVTRVFSDAGWTGINIEPMEPVFSNLCARRPHDINLRIAIEDADGEREYFAVGEGRSLSTGDPEIAARYRQSGLSVDGVVVPVRSLSSVWEDCVNGEVHFLKIDVEGAEARVLAGADLARHRPWVIVVESIESVNMEDGGAFELGTRPIPANRHDEWEHHLIDNDYRFVLFDGLNRFYVAREHEVSLGPRLEAPVNVLDRSISPSARRIITEINDHLGQIDRDRMLVAGRLDEALSERNDLQVESAALRAEIDALHRTASWRITAPLRRVRSFLRR